MQYMTQRYTVPEPIRATKIAIDHRSVSSQSSIRQTDPLNR